jgi:predicted RNase H-like HicB family nuclease
MSAGRSMPTSISMHAKVRVVVHKADEGGYWAEVPALPGCFTQAETLAELRKNVQIAVDLYQEGEREPGRKGGASSKAVKPRPRVKNGSGS